MRDDISIGDDPTYRRKADASQPSVVSIGDLKTIAPKEPSRNPVSKIDDSIGNLQTVPAGATPPLGRVDRYELLEELGGGAFGVVFRARDTVANVEVAVKGLPPLVQHNREELERVRENYALVSRLHHQRIASPLVLHQAQSVSYADGSILRKLRVQEGDYLFVMSYAPGVTLSQWRRQFSDGLVPVGKALDVCNQIAEALDYAHGQKIIHRDVKPSNVMVETLTDDHLCVRLLDFGLAAEIRSSMSRISRETGDTSGTRPYMAPEQWQGRNQGPYTDQYALAVLFYELVSGSVPFAPAFETGDPAVMVNVVLREKPQSLRVLRKPQNIVLLKGLAKDPASRYKTCGGFIDGLRCSGGSCKSAARSIVVIAICVGAGYAGWHYVYTPYMNQRNKRLEAEAVQAEHDAEIAKRSNTLQAAIQDALDREDVDVASKSMTELVALIGVAAIPIQLRDAYDAIVEERQVFRLAADAKALFDEIQSFPSETALDDRIAAVTRKWNEAESAARLRSWGSASAAYNEFTAQSRELLALNEQRIQADISRQASDRARQEAAEKEAANHAASLWNQADLSAAEAAPLFARGEYAAATRLWVRAANDYNGAKVRAEELMAYQQARSAYETALVSADSSLLENHNRNAWRNAQRLASEGTSAVNTPASGRKSYQEALAQLNAAIQSVATAQKSEAEQARTRAQVARQQAELSNASRDASQTWNRGGAAMTDAERAYKADQFSDAASSWTTAATEFNNARTTAQAEQQRQERLAVEAAARQRAEQARSSAQAARQQAELSNASRYASQTWNRGVSAITEAERAYNADQFSDAASSWTTAATEFNNARTTAQAEQQRQERFAAEVVTKRREPERKIRTPPPVPP